MLVPARFNGPPDSANGGYTCGLVAQALGAGPAEISLRAPPPLDRELTVERTDDGVAVRDGHTLVATGRACDPVADATEPVGPDTAARAARDGYARWTKDHPFPTCVVCGPARDDGLGVFPGGLGDGRFAAAWTPDPSLAGEGAAVRPEAVWAALDCPTAAPVANFGEGPPIVLARLAVSIDALPLIGEPHALVSWEVGREGRKREAACVLFDAAGVARARSRALWIQMREE